MLFLLGALDADGKLTEQGKAMSGFPLEPQFSRTLLAAEELGCIGDALTLVSILSSEGVWFHPSRQSAEQVRIATEAQARFVHPTGDHLTLLNVYREWEENGGSPEWCKTNYIHHRALRQARDIRGQLCDQLRSGGVRLRDEPRRGAGERKPGGKRAGEEALLRALCAGFYMQSARMCSAGGGWLIVGENVLVKAEGGSALDGASCEWVLYTELVGSTIAHCLMRTVSAVQPQWLSPFLPKLAEVDLKRLVGEAKPDRKPTAPERDPAELAKEKEVKVSSAKERYLARKKGGV